MKKTILLLLILTIAAVCPADALDEKGCPTGAERDLIPWEDLTHDHDGLGMHTHEDAYQFWESDECVYISYDGVHRVEHSEYRGDETHGTNPDAGGRRESKPLQEKLETLTPEDVDKLPENEREILQTLTPEQAATLTPETREALGLPEPPQTQKLTEEALVPQAPPAEPESQPQVASEPDPVPVPGLTPEEVNRLPEEAQTFIQSIPDPVAEVIEVVPTAASIEAEGDVLIRIHSASLSDLPSLTETQLGQTTLDDPESDVFLENVQFLVFSHPIVTEYMLRGWCKGQGNLPRWIELYNPHDSPVNLKQWRLKYVEKGKVKTLRFKNFHIPAGGVGILVNHEGRKSRYIDDDAVYILDIPKKALESGWLLLDAEGTEIHRIGVAFRTDALPELSDPVNPDLVSGRRVSHNRYASELPPRGGYYYGHSRDVGTPGFFQLPVSASPSKARPKLQTSWGAIKRQRSEG